jgi:hypothetical protein
MLNSNHSLTQITINYMGTHWPWSDLWVDTWIVFGLIRSELEPTIYRIRDEHAKHYTTDAVRWLSVLEGYL